MVSIGLLDRVIRSEVDREMDHDSDYLPISTVLDLSVRHQKDKARRN